MRTSLLRLAALPLAACTLNAAAGSDYYPITAPLPAPSRCGDVAQRPWCNTALSPDQRTELLLAAMSFQQKASLMAGDDLLSATNSTPATGVVDGISALGIPTQYYADGPNGVREGLATQMPSPLSLAASFDPALAHRIGDAIANEVRAKGNDLVHGPAVDPLRAPRAGRGFEAYGEDPYLSSRLGVEWIRGAQVQGVIANVKHFAVNTQEGEIAIPVVYTAVIGSRQNVNAHVDERTLRELYLPPFEAAVKEADVGTVMCAYTYLNDDPACSSAHLLQEVLRDDWGFDGFVISDYVYAVKNTEQTANVGTDVEMPVGKYLNPLKLQLAVLSGQVPTATIDAHVRAILRTLFRFRFFDRADFPSNDALIDQTAHAQLAQEAAEHGAVLLKNNGILPLDASATRIAVIGAAATQNIAGGGSSAVKPFAFVSPLEGLKARAGAASIQYDDGSDTARAASVAADASVAIVFVSKTATEGVDQTCLSLDCPKNLPNGPVQHVQDALIQAVTAANPRTIVVMQLSGATLMPWRDSIAAALSVWFPGESAGTAIARLLYGDTDPGGRLPVSFPKNEQDTAVYGSPRQYPGVNNQTWYTEGVFTGYRWHDARNIEPAYPFGHGLSYTRFGVDSLSVQPQGDRLQATVRVSNLGSRGGWAVPQLYAGLPSPSAAVKQPPHALKGFGKQWLDAGATQTFSFTLDVHALSYWNVSANDWRVADGCYALDAGLSSRDLPQHLGLLRSNGRWTIGGC